ncbi:MAG TPA: peptide-methionine (S)-S-oxide reductase MsrA [Isosphaeraceae bacterium]|jgi:peptide-methionine (S)-S-oxide reductase|nr:peptide-methionine (S)-S-oxide reductase MsrA [Isosphaeraceae bacterium]
MTRLLGTALGILIVVGLATNLSAQEKKKARAKSGSATASSAEAPKDDTANTDTTKADTTKADTSKADAPKDDSSNAKTSKADASKKKKLEKATFGGGCFWCMEAVFERIPGVKTVISGYAGGNVPNPTYEMVHSGLTGHAEVIQIEYDPDTVSYEKLLKVFWAAHDPTSLNAQGDDFGPQYRSVIFYHNEDQQKAAQKSAQDLKARRVYRSPIVTDLVPMKEFYPAELYHQNYYRNNRYSDYSLMHIAPKLKRVKVK